MSSLSAGYSGHSITLNNLSLSLSLSLSRLVVRGSGQVGKDLRSQQEVAGSSPASSGKKFHNTDHSRSLVGAPVADDKNRGHGSSTYSTLDDPMTKGHPAMSKSEDEKRYLGGKLGLSDCQSAGDTWSEK